MYNVQFTMYRSALWDACVAQRSKNVQFCEWSAKLIC